MSTQEHTIQQVAQDAHGWRNEFHSHPEVGFDLPVTSARVAQLLQEFGYELKTGFAESAVLGILRTGRPSKTIAFRADMDALPIPDKKDVPYKSKVEGHSHSCGHDAHTSLLLGLAKLVSLNPENYCGTLMFVFQPAEEGPPPGGAFKIMESGVLDDVDLIVGAHAQPGTMAGNYGVRYGPTFANCNKFGIKIKGKSTHGSSPHMGKDPLVTAAHLVMALQTIITRDKDPLQQAVLSVCSIEGGSIEVKNAIPDEVVIGGTSRCFNAQVRQLISDRLADTVRYICELHGCEYELIDEALYPAFGNDDEVTDAIERAIVTALGPEHVFRISDPAMGAEDFAYYREKIKGAFFFFGASEDEPHYQYFLHNSRFDVSPKVFEPTLKVYLQVLQNLQAL